MMLIKSYAAESAAAALKQVRQEMGSDAIILKSCRVKNSDGTHLMEITACLEKPTVAQSSLVLADANSRLLNPEPELDNKSKAGTVFDEPAGQTAIDEPTNPTPELRQAGPEMKTGSLDRLSSLAERLNRLESTVRPPLQREDSQSWFETVRRKLSDADLPFPIIESVLGTPEDSNLTESDYRTSIVERLSRFISGQIAPSIEINRGDRVVFLGPAGVGKSSVMGKIAAQLVVGKKKVKLVTFDDLKVGAPEEIATYADLLQIEVTDASSTSSANFDSVLLIDTPAYPTSTDRIETLHRQIEAANPTICIVVISALMRSSDVTRFCSTLKALRPTHVIGTMLDQTSNYGSLFAATETTKCPLLYLSETPGGMGKLTNPNAELMAEEMLALEGTHG